MTEMVIYKIGMKITVPLLLSIAPPTLAFRVVTKEDTCYFLKLNRCLLSGRRTATVHLTRKVKELGNRGTAGTGKTIIIYGSMCIILSLVLSGPSLQRLLATMQI